MKETKNIFNMGLEVVVVLLIGVILLPMSSAQDPPVDNSSSEKPCLFYAYTISDNHYFLIQNNSSVFGSQVNIVHNCDNLELRLNGGFYASSNLSFSVNIDSGINNLTLITEDGSSTFENVVFYPDVLIWESQYELLVSNPGQKEFIDIDIAELRQNWSVAFGIIMVWVLTTYVYWRLIQSYVDKNFIEEVVQ
jgi:hypothetical protein